MKIDRHRAVKKFNEYVEKYNSNDGKIKLKIDHTMRVAKICEDIALGLGLTREEIDISYLTGLLHDIGRFEQIKRYGTFNDAKSIDHAKLGVEILFKEGLIREFIDDDSEDNLIKDVIGCHNAYEIPKDFSERTKIFANILRDADKIDIFRVNVTEPMEDVYGSTEDEIYNSTVTKEVMDTFKNRETILRKTKRTAVDSVVSHIAFVFGLNFKESIKIAVDQGYLLKLIQFKSKNKIANEQFKEVKNIVNSFVDEKIN